ncbi:PqiC family protein [Paraburkholderia dinghuensis]|uniref:Membrane integrity-associated transporter subunit PqiC n=1 Tax=Paraburkholderia dinghuensis TaxID=2305225 RepID=A0A3N6N184_9BURK|nr:PqiC family protein [Paraburkholderia dinghuensis]RQH04241.1 membrane integrity-associated transporter subunit PqiC [Paraburkholderia dinghuensis]
MTFDRVPARRAGTAEEPRCAALTSLAVRRAALPLAAAIAVLTGCASPASHFYTLSAPDDATQATASTRGANPAWLIELAPVDVPPQVAKPQIVVQTGATQVDVLEQQRWASMPGDEIRRALSVDLTQRLDTIDVYGSPRPEGVPVYRVSVNVQRFESWPGSHALIDAVWSVRSLASQSLMTCRSVLNEPVGDGYDALVAGHRRAVEALSTAIASGVRSLAAQPQPMTPQEGTKAAGHQKPMSAIACPSAAPGVAAG